MADYRKVRGGAVATGGSSSLAFAAMTADEGDVAALWNFAETSGVTFTDSVSAVDLVASGTSSVATYYNHGIDLYQVVGAGALKNIAPGVTMQQNTLATATGVDSSLGNGTGSHTYEFYFKTGADDSTVQFARTDAISTGQHNFWFNRAGYIYFRIIATGGTAVACQTATDTSLFNITNNELHHVRFVYNAGVSMSIYLDGVLARTVAATALSGKTIEVDKFTCVPATISAKGTVLYQVRISHNATNNGYNYA